MKSKVTETLPGGPHGTHRPGHAPRHWPGVVVAALTATVTVMPGFTVGALAPAIEAELRISRGATGLAMSVFYAATALGSPLAKTAAARLPVQTVFATAAVVASAVLLAASRVTTVTALTVLLAVGGLSNALVQPAAGRLIAARAPVNRRSLAAGTVGAALAAATLIPGLLVAFVLPAHGWRAAMLVAAALALLPVPLTPLTRIDGGFAPRPPPGEANRSPRAPRRLRGVLALWALAAALSATGNNAVATYFVQLGTHAGLSIAGAGTLLSLSAVFAIVVRLATGAFTDLAPRRNPTVIATMMLTGGVGLALLAVGSPVAFVVGAVLAFSAGWGWTGLLLATTLRLVPGNAETAGHTVQTGIYTGAAVAPFAFGTLSGAMGFTGASLLAAVAAAAGAVATAGGALLLRRERT